MSAGRIDAYVRTSNRHAFSPKNSADVIWLTSSSTTPVKINLVDIAPAITAEYGMNGLDPVISSDKQAQRQLKIDMAISLLLTRFHEVLLAGDERLLDLTLDLDFSYKNPSKARIEDYTGLEWDWRPLASRIPNI